MSVNNITTILVDNGANLTVDFTTQVNATSATVNGSNFNGTNSLSITSKNKTAALYSGTIALSNATAKASQGSAITTSDAINATAALGKFVEVSGLDTGKSFTFGGKSYTHSDFGLVTNGSVAEDLTSSTVDLETFNAGATLADSAENVNLVHNRKERFHRRSK